ncbi:MAG: DUF1343 domain-containing protein [Ferruginibacter sp.]
MSFVPSPNEGAKTGKCFNQTCYGWEVSGSDESVRKKLHGQISLEYLLEAYRLFPGKDSFFLPNGFFNKLAGNASLMDQIKKGLPGKAIRESWRKDIISFMDIRKKYLLYPDFNKE